MSYMPIVSPYFAEATPWPYWRGPSYIRPVFGEESRKGAFRVSPIIRMPSLLGLGADPQTTLATAAPTNLPQPTPETTCAVVQTAGTAVYAKCLKLNKDLLAAANSDPAKFKELSQLVENAQKKCDSEQGVEAWAKCFYEAADPTPWYKKTTFIGASIIAGAVVLGLVTSFARRE